MKKNAFAAFILLASFGCATNKTQEIAKQPNYTWQGYVLYEFVEGEAHFIHTADGPLFKNGYHITTWDKDSMVCMSTESNPRANCFFPPKGPSPVQEIIFDNDEVFAKVKVTNDCMLVYQATTVSHGSTLDGITGTLYLFKMDPEMFDEQKSTCRMVSK